LIEPILKDNDYVIEESKVKPIKMDKALFYGGSKFGEHDDNLETGSIHHGIQRALMKLLESIS
jgi:hypothetical protein